MNKKPKTPFEQWLNYLKYQRRNCVDTIIFNEVLFKQVLKVREDENKLRGRKQTIIIRHKERSQTIIEMENP